MQVVLRRVFLSAGLASLAAAIGLGAFSSRSIVQPLAEVVDRLVVLEQGNIIADAPLAEAVRDQRVLKSYLGAAPAAVA